MGKTQAMRALSIPTWILTAALLLCACSGNSSADTTRAQDQANDALLTTGVMAKLVSIDVDATTSVHVTVQNGAVTLSGQAHSLQEQRQYVDAARSVSGVKSVNDRLSINSSLRGVRATVNDTQLAARISAAILAQTGVNAFSVQPHVRDGNVTLTGHVSSESVKKTVDATTRHVSGVRSVVDEVVVQR